MTTHHSPRGVVPPDVAEHIASHAESADQRRDALRSLSVHHHTLRMQPRTARRGGREEVNRTICTAGASEALPGTPIRAEGQAATGDPAADQAYDGLGATYAFLQDVFDHDFIDEERPALFATVQRRSPQPRLLSGRPQTRRPRLGEGRLARSRDSARRPARRRIAVIPEGGQCR